MDWVGLGFFGGVGGEFAFAAEGGGLAGFEFGVAFEFFVLGGFFLFFGGGHEGFALFLLLLCVFHYLAAAGGEVAFAGFDGILGGVDGRGEDELVTG